MCYYIQSIPAEGLIPSPASYHVRLEDAEDILDLCGPDPSALVTQIIEENEETGEKTIVKTVFSCYNPSVETEGKSMELKTKQQIGDTIKAARIKKGYTQRELGELIGFSGDSVDSIVRNIELGRRGLALEKVRICALTLGVPVEDLLP